MLGLRMAAVVPNPKSIRGFRSAEAFETWLAANHDRREELWLRIYKIDSGLPTVTYAEALDVALCWGWIDGIRKGLDGKSFLQRFTPRRSKSIWSQNNREHVARLTAAGRMTAHGQRHVDAARAFCKRRCYPQAGSPPPPAARCRRDTRPGSGQAKRAFGVGAHLGDDVAIRVEHDVRAFIARRERERLVRAVERALGFAATMGPVPLAESDELIDELASLRHKKS